MRARATVEGRQARQGQDRHHRDPVPGEQVAPDRADGRRWSTTRSRRDHDIRDESDRDGIRVVAPICRDAVPKVI
jgi:hypothetical protein